MIFNWHPILMSSGMVLSFTWAVLSFRTLPFGKPINKVIHTLFHTATVICFSVGLYAVFTGNNDPNKNDSESGYYPNLASLHSWIGIGTISLYCLNYLMGLVYFLFGVLSDESKRSFKPFHIALGWILLLMIGLAAETGIMELSAESFQCGYDLTAPDTNPAQFYTSLTMGCRLANAAGLAILLTLVCIVYSLIDLTPEKVDVKSTSNEPLMNEQFLRKPYV